MAATIFLFRIAAASLLACTLAPAWAAPMAPADLRAAKDRVEATCRTHKAACMSFSGIARDICQVQAAWLPTGLIAPEVVFVPCTEGRSTGTAPAEVLGGFVDAEGRANGLPVGVALGRTGAMLVADDVDNSVWRVSAVHWMQLRAPR